MSAMTARPFSLRHEVSVAYFVAPHVKLASSEHCSILQDVCALQCFT